MNLIQTLSTLLVNEKSTITLKMSSGDGGQLKVLVQSSLGAIPENAPESLQDAYYAYSMPFLAKGSAEQIEASLVARMSEYQQAATDCVDSISQMRQLLDQAKAKQIKKTTKPTNNSTDDDDDTALYQQASTSAYKNANSVFSGEPESDY